MFKRLLIVSSRIIVVSVLSTAIILGAFFAFLAYKPLTIEANSDLVKKLLIMDDRQLSLYKITLWFDGSLHLKGEDGLLVSKNGEDPVRIKHMQVEFSTTALLLGRISPKHIFVDGLAVELRRETDAIYIAGFPLSLQGEDQDQQASSKPLGLIDFLNEDRSLFSYFGVLKTVHAHNIEVKFLDNVNLNHWELDKATLEFERSFISGETLNVSGLFKREGFEETTPAHLEFRHPFKADTGIASLNVQGINSAFFDNYIPFTSPIKTTGDAALQLTFREGGTLEKTRLDMKMNEGSIHALGVYNFPFQFKEGTLSAIYNHDDNYLAIEKLNVVDNTDWPISVTGNIYNLTSYKDLDFELTLTAQAPTTVDHVASYLPDKRIAGVTNWIRTHIHGSKVKNLLLKYTGKPSELPFCDKLCGFDGTFDYEDMNLEFLNHNKPAKGLSGKFVMKEDYIKITSTEAVMGDQKITNAEAIISGHFSKDIDTGISVKAHVQGGLKGLLNIIENEGNKTNKPWGVAINGAHESTGSVYVPFKGFHVSKIVYDVTSKVTDVKLPTLVPQGAITIPKGTVHLNQNELKLEAPGTFGELNVNYQWRENMQNPMGETLVSVQAELPVDYVENLLKPVDISLTETVDSTITLKAVDKGNFNLDFYADLRKNTLTPEFINWHKDTNQSLVLKATGIIEKGVKTLPLQVSAEGENVKIKGNITLGDTFGLDFSTFEVGRNNLKAAYKHGLLNIVGQQLDMSHKVLTDLGKEDSKDTSESPFQLTANLEKMLLKNGDLNKVNMNLLQKNGKLNSFELGGNIDDGKVSLEYKYPSSDYRTLLLKGENLGDFLYRLGSLSLLRGGQGEVKLDVYDIDGIDRGTGVVNMRNVYMVEAPIVVRLLSLISLSELLSSKKGIYFKELDIPFRVDGDVLSVDHAVLSGPSIGLRLKGRLLVEGDDMDIDGQLIPAEGLNSLVSKIPVLGTLLTGSQSGLLVANFSVEGSRAKPKISANPLSFVMPGLVKDFFGTIFKKESRIELPDDPKTAKEKVSQQSPEEKAQAPLSSDTSTTINMNKVEK